MSDTRPDLPELLADLTGTLEQLQSQLEPAGRPPLRPPTPGDLARFTSEVTIPAVVLVLETNVRVLKLLQRVLRMTDDRAPDDRAATGTRDRVESLGQATLTRLDSTLTDLQNALEGRPVDDETGELLSEARSLRTEIEDRLAAADDEATPGGGDRRETVNIDVESELRSIKRDVDDGADSSPDEN